MPLGRHRCCNFSCSFSFEAFCFPPVAVPTSTLPGTSVNLFHRLDGGCGNVDGVDGVLLRMATACSQRCPCCVFGATVTVSPWNLCTRVTRRAWCPLWQELLCLQVTTTRLFMSCGLLPAWAVHLLWKLASVADFTHSLSGQQNA